MKEYTVQQLAKLAGISVRTLHHYDEIGLLKPQIRTAARYRIYLEEEVLRLQQILFFKELGVSLNEIKKILDSPQYNPVKLLKEHRAQIEQKAKRYKQLLITIDNTIKKIQGEFVMTSDKEFYKGFTPEEKAIFNQYEEEATQHYDPELVKQVNNKVKQWSKEKWKTVQVENEAISLEFSKVMGKPVDDKRVQQLVARHHAHIGKFFFANAEVYKGLGELYVSDSRFKKNYDKYQIGLAEFMKEAIAWYANNVLK